MSLVGYIGGARIACTWAARRRPDLRASMLWCSMEYIALVYDSLGIDWEPVTLIYILIGVAVAIAMLLVVATRGD